MTDSNAYYKAYYNVTKDATKKDQVDYVARYFKDLGYGVKVAQNLTTTDTITWNITW